MKNLECSITQLEEDKFRLHYDQYQFMLEELERGGLIEFRSIWDFASKMYTLMQDQLDVHFSTFLTRVQGSGNVALTGE